VSRALMIALGLSLSGILWAQTPVREGAFEKLVLDPCTDAAVWHPAEATVQPTKEHVAAGQSALDFHIDVDFHAGEKNYPIGWPRMYRRFEEPWQQNWSAYDYFHFSIYTDTSREALPTTPLGLIVYTPDKARAYHRTLKELKKGEWIEFLLPLSDIPRHDHVPQLQFFISESNYRDHDKLDFLIRDICLLRYAEPTVAGFAPGYAAIFADQRWLPVKFDLLGIKPGSQATVKVEIRRGAERVAAVEQRLARGSQMVWLDLGAKPVTPGAYEAEASIPGTNATPVRSPLRVVSSPWKASKEGSR